MTDSNVPFLRMGEPITDEKGIPLEWFRNGFNALLQRTGTQTTNTLLGVVNGASQAAAEAAAAAASAQATANAASQTAQAASTNGFSLTLNVPFLYEFSDTGGTQTTSSATVTASGGTAPYTYAWTKTSGDTLTLSGASSNTTTFAGDPSLDSDGTLTAEYKCTVTDSAGSPLTANVSIGVTIVYLGA